METHIENIRKACIAANSEIMELKFGCEVMINLSYTKKHAMITRCLDTSKSMYQWVELPWQQEGIKHEYCTDKSKMKILGRPIRLADVLLAMGSKSSFSYFYNEKKWMFSPVKDTHPRIEWDLRNDDLTQQSPETVKFLAELLTNQ